jgi:hypothetical protein
MERSSARSWSFGRVCRPALSKSRVLRSRRPSRGRHGRRANRAPRGRRRRPRAPGRAARLARAGAPAPPAVPPTSRRSPDHARPPGPTRPRCRCHGRCPWAGVRRVASRPGPRGRRAASSSRGRGRVAAPRDEALGLAVGPGRVAPRALVLEAGLCTGLAEGAARAGRALVLHHPPGGDAQAHEPRQRAGEEGHRALPPLAGKGFGVGQPRGVVVDADVRVLPADPPPSPASVARDSVPDVLDPAQLLDVEVDQPTRPPEVVADHRRLRVQRRWPA